MRIANPPRNQEPKTKPSLTSNERETTVQVGAVLSQWSDGTCDRLLAQTTPEVQQDRLVDRIMAAVPDLARYLAVYAAALVLSDSPFQMADLDRMLRDVSEGRRKGTIHNPAAWFNKTLQNETARKKIPWCPTGDHRQLE